MVVDEVGQAGAILREQYDLGKVSLAVEEVGIPLEGFPSIR